MLLTHCTALSLHHCTGCELACQQSTSSIFTALCSQHRMVIFGDMITPLHAHIVRRCGCVHHYDSQSGHIPTVAMPLHVHCCPGYSIDNIYGYSKLKSQLCTRPSLRLSSLQYCPSGQHSCPDYLPWLSSPAPNNTLATTALKNRSGTMGVGGTHRPL